MFIRNGESIDDDDGLLTDSAFQFGYSVYSTLLIVDRKPVWLPQHLDRLNDSVAYLEWPKLDKSGLRRTIRNLAKKNVTAKARMRVQLSLAGALAKNPTLNTTITVQSLLDSHTEPLLLWGAEDMKLPTTRVGLPGYLKWNQNAVNIMIRRKAVASGFNDGILYTADGFISESCFGNLCWIKDDVLHYPADECWPLDGLSKKHILEIAETTGIDTKAGRYKLSDVLAADEVFLTSSIQLMRPIAKINKSKFKLESDTVGQKLRRLLYTSVGLKL